MVIKDKDNKFDYQSLFPNSRNYTLEESKAYEEFLNSFFEPLGYEFDKILHDNLDDLLVRDDP